MSRQGTLIFRFLLTLMLAAILSCADEPQQASTPNKVVSKKIATQPAPARAVQPKPNAMPAPTPNTALNVPQDANVKGGSADKPSSDLIQESLELATTYDPSGRFDPFEPLFKDEPETPTVKTSDKDKRKKRKPQTPLERVALGQLKLSAIIRAPSGNRALVEDATGKGYVVQKGTYIGLNAGQVVQIDKDTIVIEEEIENVLGELTIQNTELKLQKPAGEL